MVFGAATILGQHLLGDVVVFEALDVLKAAFDVLFAPFGFREGTADGFGKCFGIVGMNVKTVGATGLFKTRTCGCNDGQAALNGFDDGNAETLVARGIDEAEGLLVDGGQMVVGHSAEQMDTAGKAVALGKGKNLLAHVAGLPSHEHEMNVAEGGLEQRLDSKECVLARFYGAYREDETLGELVEVANFSAFFICGCLAEARSTTLIDDVDAFFGEVAECEDVALGAFGNGDDALGFA